MQGRYTNDKTMVTPMKQGDEESKHRSDKIISELDKEISVHRKNTDKLSSLLIHQSFVEDRKNESIRSLNRQSQFRNRKCKSECHSRFYLYRFRNQCTGSESGEF